MKISSQVRSARLRRHGPRCGFTLVEVLVSLGLSALLVGGVAYGYIYAARRAEWSAYSLAAQALAIKRLEQSRAAKWDPMSYPVVDELVSANFPVQVEMLDIPVSGTNIVWATNFTAVRLVTSNPPLKEIRVDCVWTFLTDQLYTNTIATYRAPDQ